MNSTHRRLLFVYGTLKRGCSNHRQLAGQTFIAAAHTAAGFRLFDLGDYPGMVAVPGDREGVSGEVWAVDSVCLLNLDSFEGVAEGLYRRAAIAMRPPHNDKVVEAYVYELPIGDAPEIGSIWVE